MTKAEIVQELLDKGYINAEKAVVLLTNEIQRGITYIPNQHPNPYWTTSPDWTGNPNLPYCGTSTSGGTITDNTTNTNTKENE